ncbi:hypothetical protein PLICRDRAFT_89359 [Plicaturopsis crispa FD-325 SS-3]|nr:hypothetical protein PLICRDRAFT_89359 [Plicaturopsis crispa FD-325 SS-3]
MPSVCTAKASYKKLPGLLELTDSHLQWTQDGKRAPSVRVARSDAASLFCSKEGAAQVRLKIALVGDDTGHNFAFTSPQPIAYTEREKFKQELTNIISRNRSGAANVPPHPAAVAASPAVPTAAPPRPSLPAMQRAASTSRAASVSSERRTPTYVGNDAANDFRLRKRVLLGNPELAALHRQIVMSGQITEAEFWEHREHLLHAEMAAENQKRGRPGQLVDPRPQTVEGGEIKIVITPQLVHDIFEEYPVVAKAYSENVPNKLSEADFWKRYFQSKLFNTHRASVRSSAAQHVDKPDPIFDKYLEKEDNELEPRRQRDEGVEMFVDLGATEEDHGETGNEKDITMQAGRKRDALPLIRKFNEHSERLLNSALGDVPPAKRRRTDSGREELYSQIDLDDLHDPEGSAGIILQMQDRQRYFEGRMAGAVDGTSKHDFDSATAIREAKDALGSWQTSLTQLSIERKAGDAALLSMTQNVAARLDVNTKKSDIPVALFSQLTTCQTAANEFLRQFWSTIYPPPTELQTLAVATPAQKAAKAARMIGYLSKTHEKVDALIRAAQSEGVDPARVEVAMKPILNAVDQALAFHNTKRAPRA